MALKGDRFEFKTDISFFNDGNTATRGGVASLVTAGSGAAMDQSAATVGYSTNSSGVRPIGVLLNDVVNLDLTRQHINWHKNEVQVGMKVTLLQQGWCVTNNIVGTPAVGDVARLGSSGALYPYTILNDITANKALNPYVGKFLSTKDEDGYAKFQPEL